MNNKERRIALNTARANAYHHAQRAEKVYDNIGEDGPEVLLATMWANVAEAMKDGDPSHDGPDGHPTILTRDGIRR